MMKLLTHVFFLAIACSYWACNGGSNPQTDNAPPLTPPDEIAAATEIRITPVESPTFPDAKIGIQNIGGDAETIPAGPVPFAFDVTNYELGNQTPDAADKMCANSGKGQHIHLILNNTPYSAHYTAAFERELEEGHYEMLAFLSRSYHESIKTKDAYTMTHFDVGPEQDCAFKHTSPHLFYSRPKGTYLGNDTKKLLLDFYLVNCDLSADGYRVKATINDIEFMIAEWRPYFIEGLPMGEVRIKLELLDAEGNLVDSPFNPVERTVTLAEDEPLPAS